MVVFMAVILAKTALPDMPHQALPLAFRARRRGGAPCQCLAVAKTASSPGRWRPPDGTLKQPAWAKTLSSRSR